MAATTLSDDGRHKTMLIYRQGSGIAITRFDRRGKSTKEIAITPDELEAIVKSWPQWREFLSNAGAQNVAPATPSPNGSRASPERASSPSSPVQEPLL
jgi:hypothetical protein